MTDRTCNRSSGGPGITIAIPTNRRETRPLFSPGQHSRRSIAIPKKSAYPKVCMNS